MSKRRTETAERPKRKAIPTALKLQLLLEQDGRCGCGCGDKMDAMREGIEYQHMPPLRARAVNEAGTDYIPPQHDPRGLMAFRKPCHRKETRTSDRLTIHKSKQRHEPKARTKKKIPQKTPEQRRAERQRQKEWAERMKADRRTGEPV